MRKRRYILLVSREEDGRVKKIALPMQYVYGFVAAALVGTFTMAGLAGSYTRMLLKTESFNQVRQERETLRQNYQKMAQIAHERDVQVASLGALASEVTSLYGLRHDNKLTGSASAQQPVAAATPAALSEKADMSDQQLKLTIDQFYALRSEALAGGLNRNTRGLNLRNGIDLGSGLPANFANAPTLWPVEGRLTSSFGEREDPFNGEGAFHSGIDIAAPKGTPVHAPADGDVQSASMMSGYGREIVLNHGNDLSTLYGHLSGWAVTAGQHVVKGQIIGYVGSSGRSTGSHLHYEVRVHNVPVNPHKYLQQTYSAMAATNTSIGGEQ